MHLTLSKKSNWRINKRKIISIFLSQKMVKKKKKMKSAMSHEKKYNTSIGIKTNGEILA